MSQTATYPPYEPFEGELLHYENITFVRSSKGILNGVNWHVKTGENWALLGLNGAGKSTLLGMIMAYTCATRGDLRVLGYEFGKCVWKKVKDQVGFVSSTLGQFASTLQDEPALHVVASGKNSLIGMYHDISDEDRAQATAILEDIGLLHKADSPFGVLSTGEQRRILIGRAFMNQPKLMVLDEPCNGLDVPSREYLLTLLEEQVSTGKYPIIYVSHQIEEIIPSITHVAILKDGVIYEAGPKEEIITDEILSEAYGIPVHVEWSDGRPWLMVNKSQ